MTAQAHEVTTCTRCGAYVGLAPTPGAPANVRTAVDLADHHPTTTPHRCGPHGLPDDHPLNTTSPLDPRRPR